MKNLKKLKIWQKGMEIVLKTYELSRQLPPEEKYGLAIQSTKAAVSIPSNIAESSAKSGKNDYRKYLEIALGSSYELETQVLIIQMLQFGDMVLIESLLKEVDEEQKMILSFIKTVEGNV